ncbi:hypothetical protein EXIGLDRAFT_774460 [Exidia glandulosa HHB12029]|uniref:F-box domain-containing protein n=1 Tax=Exidia glandulosa HHB12029 TaxID=1314781 RepID=A0A165EC18_EXIGL|nr:hypothetical protein EXIGLDRAFT_774460 [Exidia glandulosa HHB12029]
MSGRDVRPAVHGDTVTPIFCSSLSAQTGMIPFDVLSMVFSLLTQDDWICVSGVCRHWRAAALGDKRLWCNITIRAAFSTAPVLRMSSTRDAAFDPNDGLPCCSVSQTYLPVSSNHPIIPALLHRSGSLPISLDFHFSVHYDMRLVHSSIIAITENASRIRSLTIRAEGCPAWMSMLASLPEYMPLLSRIVLCISEIAPTRSHDISDFGLRSRDRWARYQSLSHIEMNGIADDAGFGALLASAIQCPTVTTVLIGHIGITPLYLKSIFYLFPALCTIEILGCKDGAPGQWHTHHASVDVPTTLTEFRTGRFQTLELTRASLCILRARRLHTLSVWIPLPSALQFTDVFSHLGPLYDVTIDIDEEQHDCSLTALDVAGCRRRAIMHNPFGGVPQFSDLIAPLDLSCLVRLTIPNHFWKEMLRSFGSGGVSFPALRTFCFTFIPYLRFVGVVGFMHAANSMRRMRGAAPEVESDVPLAAGPHCALSTVSRASVPLRCPALRSLEFRKWRDCDEECVVPIQMLVDVAESFDFDADQEVEINIQGLAVVDSKGLSLDDGLLRLRRLASISKLVYGRRVY